MSIAHP